MIKFIFRAISFRWILIFHLLFFIPAGFAQHLSSIGISGYAAFPIGNLADWYSLTPEIGTELQFKPRSNLGIELQYQFAYFGNGAIEEKAFQWPVDKAYYQSPQADANMTTHSLQVNFLFYVNKRTVLGKNMIPYITLGSGFFAFQNHVENLIYPGQASRPLDTSLKLPAITDEQVALSANLGIGLDIPVSRKISLDLRLRYHLIMGTIRPFEDWEMEEVFPLQMFDSGLSIQYQL
ncbi:hypothetical protein JXJ21_11665 [candidate division KSB1 bacterium]|nr:hypothetical protein [candidate division KSB1 bacterium]